MVSMSINMAIAQCNAPTINSFSPTTGYIGSNVTISGSNFDPVAANNQVFFGATKATILSGSFSTLTVKVPTGATYAPITVKNSCGLIVQSNVPFNGIFCGTLINSTSFNQVAYSRSVSGGYGMVSQDMDLDGKPELLVVGFTTNTLGVLRNLSTPGNFLFDAPLNLTVPSNTRCVTTGDYDGDGKVDMALTVNGVGIYVYRNLSTPGSLSFAAPLTITGGNSNTYQIATGDLNRDGKLDLAFTCVDQNVYILRNTSSGAGAISFAGAITVNDTYALTGISIIDIDKDGIGDIATSAPNNNVVSVIRNTTTAGSNSLTFDNPTFYNTNSSYPYRLFSGDFDKDGRIDLVTNNHSGATTSIFRNTSTPGSVSFDAAVNVSSPSSNYRLGVGDADGDGSPDLVTKSSGENLFSVYKNTTTGPGNISFAARVDYPGQAEVSGIIIADLDGDFVPDISTSGISYNTLRVHRNTSSVSDNVAPTAICKNINLALSPSGTATLTPDMIDGGSSDACGINSYSVSRSSFSCADLGHNSVVLTVTDRSGNSSTCTADVNIVPAAIIVAGNSTVCEGQTVSLEANLGDSYQWKKDGSPISGATNRNYIASTSGAYTVVVTNGGGCSGESPAINVVISPAPSVSISADGSTNLCQGNTVTLTASDAASYTWSNGAVTQSITVGSAGNYFVTVQDANGCSGVSNTINVTIKSAALPDASVTASGSLSFCQGGSVTLSASQASEYLWSNGATTQSIVVSQSGSYSVKVTNSDGCFRVSSAVAVNVKPVPTVTASNDVSISPGGSTQLDAVGAFSGSVAPVETSLCLFDVNGGNGNCNFSDNLCNDGYAFQNGTSYSTVFSGGVISSLDFLEYYTNCGGVSTFNYYLNGNYIGTYSDGGYSCTCSPASAGTYPRTNSIPASQFSQFVNSAGNNVLRIDISSTGTLYMTGARVIVKSPGETYSWSPAAGLSNASVKNPIASPSQTTTYTVTYTIPNGCSATDQVTVSVGTAPQIVCPANISVGTDDGLCGAYVNFAATETVGNPASTISYSVQPNSFFELGTHEVTATATNSVGSSSCTFSITVSDDESPVIGSTIGNPVPANTSSQPLVFLKNAGVKHGGSPYNHIMVDAADFDKDGDKDLLYTTNNSYLTFKNNGLGVMAEKQQLFGVYSSSVAAGDLNGDGYPDAVIGVWGNHQSRVYLNNGSGNLVAHQINLGGLDRINDSKLADLDGDGDLDIFFVGSGYTNRNHLVYFNDGSGNFTQSAQSFNNDAWGGKVALGDYDGNGTIDAFVTADFPNNMTKLWLNNGSGNFTESSQVFPGGSGVRAGDIDGDGDLDISMAINSGNAVNVYKNNGSGIFTLFGAGNFSAPSNPESYAIDLGDLDLDGDLDMAVGYLSNTQNPIVFENNGSGVFSKVDEIVLEYEWSMRDIILVDMDNDGDLDFVDANGGYHNEVAFNQLKHPVTGGTQDIIVNNDNGQCGAVVSYAHTASDNCSASVAYDIAPGSFFSVGSTLVTATATDASGNQGSSAFHVIVKDVQAPSIACPSNISVYATSAAGAVVNYQTPVGTDNCASTTSLIEGLASGSTFPIGQTKVSFKVVDASGNANQCSFFVNVTGLPPEIVCPSNIVLNNDQGACGAIVSYAASESHAIPASTISYSIAPGSFFAVGTTQVTATATNAVGSSSCTFTVTINDNEAPMLTSQASDLVVQCDGAGNQPDLKAWLDGRGSVPVQGCSNSNFYWSNSPTANGNAATGTINGVGYTYTSSSPVLTSPGLYNYGVFPSSYGIPNQNCIRNIYVTNNTLSFDQPMYNPVLVFASIGQGGVSVPIQFSAPVTVLFSQAVVQNSSTKITGTEGYAIVRLNGVFNSISFDYLAQENYVNFSFGADFVTPCTTGGAQASDNCGGITWTNNYSGLTPGCGNTGSATVTWTATDSHGNSSSTSATFSIVDNIAPVIAPKADVVQNTDAGVCGAIVNFATSASDNCGAASLSYSPASGSFFELGSTLVNVTATDACGNIATSSFNVVVQDHEAPVALCKSISIELDANGQASIQASDLDAGSHDACGIASISIDKSSFDCSNVGNNSVRLTVVDNNGNSSSCLANVSVADHIAPIAKCKSFTLELSGGSGIVSPSDVDGGSSDACGIASMSVSPNSFTCANSGLNVVTLTVIDNNGNSSSCQANVLVNIQPSSSIAVIPANNTYTGGIPNNIYLGYGSQSVTLQANANGGSGFTYSWSPAAGLSSSSVAAPVFTPTAAGNYTFTVTIKNSNGCITKSMVSLCVKDARAEKGKILLCHVPPGNAGNPQLLSIAASAVPAHLTQHSGDQLGSCASYCGVASRSIDEQVAGELIIAKSFEMIVYPNPFENEFITRIESEHSDFADLFIFDVTGRMLKVLTNQPTNTDIRINENFNNGIYFVQVKVGDEYKMIKVIKD